MIRKIILMKYSRIKKRAIVRIKKGAETNFPDQCVYCQKKEPEENYNYLSRRGPYRRWRKRIAQNAELKAPCCKSCINIIHRRWRIRNYLLVTIYLVTLGIFALLEGTIDISFGLLALALIIVAVINMTILDRYWYREPLTISTGSRWFQFEFTNKKYAERFEELNRENLYPFKF